MIAPLICAAAVAWRSLNVHMIEGQHMKPPPSWPAVMGRALLGMAIGALIVFAVLGAASVTLGLVIGSALLGPSS